MIHKELSENDNSFYFPPAHRLGKSFPQQGNINIILRPYKIWYAGA